MRRFLNRSMRTSTVLYVLIHRVITYSLVRNRHDMWQFDPDQCNSLLCSCCNQNPYWCLVMQSFLHLPRLDFWNSKTVNMKINLKETWKRIINFCSAARSSSMRTGITMSTASAVSAAIARWQMSLSPARRTPCSAMTATAMSSPPSAWPATRSSCQVKIQGSFAL